MTALLDSRPDVEMFNESSTNPTTTTIADPHNQTMLTSSTITNSSTNSSRVLVVGAMESAQNGQYQQTVEKLGLGGIRPVEMYMIDRLSDGASTLEKSSYPTIYLVLPLSHLDNNRSILVKLNEALTPEGSFTIESPSIPDEGAIQKVKGQLEQAGFVNVETSSNLITAKKSASSSSSSTGLPLRRKLGNKSSSSSSSKKKALWNITAAQDAPLIDQDSLLTEADRKVPSATRREDCMPEGGKRKKACKGCTCGQKEIEEAEEEARQAALRQNIVQLDASDMDMPAGSDGLTKTEVTETMVDENGITRVIKRIKVDTSGATSSCGSCFLGDAFRCSGCPYLGLPAFKPGEKVEILPSMDDDL